MGGPHIVSFSAPLNKAKYEISINQLGKREISILISILPTSFHRRELSGM
jgi:hypothetical protein